MEASRPTSCAVEVSEPPVPRELWIYLITFLVCMLVSVGALFVVNTTLSGSVPGFSEVPLPSPFRFALFGLTALIACGALDMIVRRLLDMRRGLQPLAIVLGALGFSTAVEAFAYLLPGPPELFEQRYHFAMQHLITSVFACVLYVAVRRVFFSQRRGALTAVLDNTHCTTRSKAHAVDAFVVFNLLLFMAMTVLFYQDRFIHYRGQAHIAEFYFYAILIFSSICVLWRIFRHSAIPAGVLAVLQIGILMHFAGGLVVPESGRLYDVYFAGVRYDKYVHLVNGCATGLLVCWVWKRGGVRWGGLAALTIGLAVLGLGGVVEIAEYAVYCTVPSNGVGGYDNNMQDLYSNLLGVLIALLTQHRLATANRR
jgi:hypothetical protein